MNQIKTEMIDTLIYHDQLYDKFSYDNPMSIMRSNIPLVEKRIQIYMRRKELDETLKKLNKEKVKQGKTTITFRLVLLFLVVTYLFTQNLGLSFVLLLAFLSPYFFRFLLQGPKITVDKMIKNLEKEIKEIDKMLKILSKSE